MEVIKRLRKVCPQCNSLAVRKSKKTHNYKCEKCKAHFQRPREELKTAGLSIPRTLKEITRKKKTVAN